MYKYVCPLLLLILPVTQTAFAARPLAPPVEELKSSPELVRIVAVVAGEKQEPPRVKFAITEQFSGESPKQMSLRLDEGSYEGVVTGRGYILAWTDMRKVKLVRKAYEKDPDGPSVVEVRGLNSLALFEDSPELRFLFSARETSDVEDATREIDALLSLMSGEDASSRHLAIAQLFLKRELSGDMNPQQVGKLRQVLRSPELSAEHRDYLLQSSLRLPEDLRSGWLGEELRKVIILHGTQYDLSSFVPGLVKNAAAGLGQVGNEDDIGLLSMLLYANNPGVVKAALSSMDQLDPAATAAEVSRATQRGWVVAQAKPALEKYLEQAATREN